MASDTLTTRQPSLPPTLELPTLSKTRQPSLEPTFVSKTLSSDASDHPASIKAAILAPQSSREIRAGLVEPPSSSQVRPRSFMIYTVLIQC